MPSKFWSKSSSSQSFNSDPALEIPRTQSRKQDTSAYAPRPPSQTSYDPYSEHYQSTASLNSTSSQGYLPSNPAQTGPQEQQPQIGGQPYEQHYQEPDPSQAPASSHRNVLRKSIKTRLLGASSSAKDEPETPHKESRFFGRRKSVKKQDRSPSRTQQHPLYQDIDERWQLDTNQPPPDPNHPDKFVPFSPDFTPEQLGTRQQQQQQASGALGQSQGQPQYAPVFRYPAPRPGQTRLTEQIPPLAGTQTPPNKPSFESLRQPPSITDPNSRPNSRQSVEHRSLGQQQSPYRHHPDAGTSDPNLGTIQVPQRQARSGLSPYRHPDEQALQPPPLNVVDLNKQSSGGEMPRDNQSNLRPDNQGAVGSNNGLGHSPNPLTGGPSPSFVRVAQTLREGEMGRRTPPPQPTARDLTEVEVDQLLISYRELAEEHESIKKKYNNAKKQFFQQQAQTHTLQNTLAQQRLSLSRTSLDDGEYAARFNRLDGLIANLAHSIRKEWGTVPEWLQPAVNKNAVQLGAKEMIVAGRAIISRWLLDEVFDKYFHPDLDVRLSTDLRAVQGNLRSVAPPAVNREEDEALTSKIINWRLTTVEGLMPILRGPASSTNRAALIEALSEQLLKDVGSMMKGQPPPELNGGIHMIVELAVGILMHIPLESRDIQIEYYEPGKLIDEDLMKIEGGLAPLAGPDADQLSLTESTSSDPSSNKGDAFKSDEAGKKSFLGGLIGHKKTSSSSVNQPKQGSQAPDAPLAARDDDAPVVRICAALSVRTRGKMILVKAPVFRM